MILRDKIYINIAELGYKVSNLCELFTYKNPEIFHKKRLKLSIRNTPPFLYHYKIVDTENGGKVLQIPRGGLPRVIEFYKSNNLPFRLLDQRIEKLPIDVHLIDTILDKHQEKLVNILINNEGGLVEAPPGMGKSITMLGLISILRQPTLILVHELRLSDQWMTEIQKRLGGSYTLGKYDGDVKKDGDIIVGVINSIYNLYQENPAFFDKFGTIIEDEVQHCPSDMFLSVLNNIPAKYRIGVSGTIKRKDQKELLTYDVFGKVLIKLDAADLKHRITTFDYRVVNTNIHLEIPTIYRWTGQKREDVLNMTELLTKLVENKDRNVMIVGEAIDLIQKGYFPLILSDRVQHNESLYETLIAMGFKTVLMIGKTRKKTKWDEIRNDTTIQCIVANSKIASEGLDLPRLSALLLTCPSTNVHKLKQQIGRIRRVCENKPTPIVIDFVDNLACTHSIDEPNYLLRHTARTRIRFYEKLKNEYDDPDIVDT